MKRGLVRAAISRARALRVTHRLPIADAAARCKSPAKGSTPKAKSTRRVPALCCGCLDQSPPIRSGPVPQVGAREAPSARRIGASPFGVERPLFALRHIVRAEDMAFAERYVLRRGSPHAALGSPGGSWGTGSPVPPIECRASFLPLNPLAASAISQLMQRAEVFDRQSRPTLCVTSCPQITGYASGKTLAAIVDLDQLLPAVMTATPCWQLRAGSAVVISGGNMNVLHTTIEVKERGTPIRGHTTFLKIGIVVFTGRPLITS